MGTEQRHRGLLVGEHPRGGGYAPERIKKLSDYEDTRPVVHDVLDLTDFRLTLEQLRERVDALMDSYGAHSEIYVDAGHNNVSVYVEVNPDALTSDNRALRRE